MDEFEFPEDITALSAEDLAASETAAVAAFDRLRALGDDLTDEQIEDLEALSAHVVACRAENERRQGEVESRAARGEAAAAALTPTEPEEPEASTDPEEGDPEPEPEAEEPEAVAEDPEPEAVAAAAAVRRRSRIAAVPKKAVVKPPNPTAVITAAADIPGVPAASTLADLAAVAKAFIARSKAFPSKHHNLDGGTRPTEQRHQYGIASFSRGPALDLTDEDTRFSDGMELLTAAGDEHRLPGGSLTASGGWCAPSEVIYDLCPNRASLDGLWDVPEIGITRGGIRFTQGIDWRPVAAGDGYNGFWQTEAQAIAGTTKTCFEVTCAEFEEVRLDAVGVCIKAPILTNVAYPELVRQWIEGTLIFQQHRVSSTLLGKAVTALGPATNLGGAGGLTYETLTSLELVALGLKEDERMSFSDTLEVVLPFWMKAAIRGDLANRTGVENMLAVSDAQIDAYFAARGLRVQYVYNWQGLGGSPVVDYPDSVQVAMYPAGTFVKGTADVISLDTVYDSTDLTSNIYTAAFVEEGVLLAQRCGNGALVEIPVCVSGETGAADLSDCYGVTDVAS